MLSILVLSAQGSGLQLDSPPPSRCKAARTYSTLGLVTTGIATTGMVAPLVVAPNTELGPVLALGTAATASPLWIVSGIGTLANARRCGRADAVIAGVSYLAVGASVPVAAGLLGGGILSGDLGLSVLGGLGAVALGVLGVPMLVVGGVSSVRLLAVPSAGSAPGLTVVGRF